SKLRKEYAELSEDYRQYLKEEKEQSVAYLITKLADTVSVLQYSNRELQLGNQTQSMKVINDGAVERVSKLIDKLETSLGL
ncbi:hypothetical protein ABFY54_29420, partial [Priestia megaterium]|uniref:hypothetical protein n=1 Tax=Priestia megaterium TaxID=1404 RepID=UPI003D2E3BD5